MFNDKPNNNPFKKIAIGLVAFMVIALTFCQPADANHSGASGCFSFDDITKKAADFSKDAGRTITVYAWDGSKEPGMIVVYVVIEEHPAVYIHVFKDGCMIPVLGKDVITAQMNETIKINISNSAVIFDNRESF